MNNCFVVILALFLGQAFILAKPLLSSNDATKVEFRSKKSTVRSVVISFEAFAEGGLRVKVLDVAGLGYLSFNAKVNLPVGKKQKGDLVQNIANLSEHELILDFPDRLLVGDAINYWIRIQYNGLSLNSKSLSYVVRDLTPGPINTLSNKAVAEESTTPLYSNRIPTTPRRKPQDTSECACDKNTLSEMWAKMNRTADKVLILEETITPLKDKIKVLAETIDELVDIQNVGTSLLLTGNLPAQTNAVEDVRHLLIEKLNLRDLSNSIVQAKYIECGEIAFEVASSIDKLRILKRSRDILSKLPYRIEDPNRRADIDIRFSSEERCSPSSPLKELSNPIGNLNTRVKVQSGVVPV